MFLISVTFEGVKELKTIKAENDLTKLKIEAVSRGVAEFVQDKDGNTLMKWK